METELNGVKMQLEEDQSKVANALPCRASQQLKAKQGVFIHTDGETHRQVKLVSSWTSFLGAWKAVIGYIHIRG